MLSKKGSIFHIKRMYIQPFSMEVGLTRNLTFNGNICYVLYLVARFYLVGQRVLCDEIKNAIKRLIFVQSDH